MAKNQILVTTLALNFLTLAANAQSISPSKFSQIPASAFQNGGIVTSVQYAAPEATTATQTATADPAAPAPAALPGSPANPTMLNQAPAAPAAPPKPPMVRKANFPREVSKTLAQFGMDTQLVPVDAGAEPPVEVIVNKTEQTISIKLYGEEIPLKGKEMLVSTGGTLKVPTGRGSGPRAYCGDTPDIPRKVIMASNQSMEPIHYSNRFSDDYGQEVPMPWTIWAKPEEGIAFHQVPSTGMNSLGRNVSGGCIRLHPTTAKLLFGLMMKYGGIVTEIAGENPPNGPRCTPEMVQAKLRQIQDDEDGYGYGGGWFSNWFNEDNSRSRSRGSSRKSRSRDNELLQHPLGRY